jgi:predicted histone-like DNA-binding protein
MAGHNSAFSKGVITGVLADLVECVRELAYEGKSVKIDNLGIFRVSMKSKGVEDAKEFSASTDITSKWQVRPTGECVTKAIGVTRAGGAMLTWEEDNDYTSPRSETPEP